MGTPYVGEIRIFAGNFPPAGWMFCDGSLLAIAQFDTLFNIIGTTYGGDGQSTFALPGLASRFPVHQGTGGGASYVIGQNGGTESVTLTTPQIPRHNHVVLAAGAGTTGTPSGATILSSQTEQAGFTPAPAYVALFDGTKQVALAAQSIGSTGQSQPHDNMIPYLAVNYIISLFGIFPSQT